MNMLLHGVENPDIRFKDSLEEAHAGVPNELFAGKDKVIEGIFSKLETFLPGQAAGCKSSASL
jgi:hypothetical protein